MFTKTSPWPLKLVILAVVILSEHSWVQVPKNDRHRPILYMLSAYILSTLLPSVVFAVPNRHQTTTYVMQTVLMLLYMFYFISVLHIYGQQKYEVASIQLIMSHILWAQSEQLHTKAQIMLYQGIIVFVNRLLLLAVVFFYAFLLPRNELEHLTLLALLFVPEVLGLFVSVLSLVIQELGIIFENFMLS